jgi:hypothetical protein
MTSLREILRNRSIVGLHLAQLALAIVFGMAIATLISTSGFAEGDDHNDCQVPGITARWMAAYCMQKAETDDYESELVQDCVNSALKEDSVQKMSACNQNKYWKKRICELAYADVEKAKHCVADPAFVPTVVKQGVGE